MNDLTISSRQFDAIPGCASGTAKLVQSLGKTWVDDDPIPIGYVIDTLGEEYALLAINAIGTAPKLLDALTERAALTISELTDELAARVDAPDVQTDLSAYDGLTEDDLIQSVTADPVAEIKNG